MAKSYPRAQTAGKLRKQTLDYQRVQKTKKAKGFYMSHRERIEWLEKNGRQCASCAWMDTQNVVHYPWREKPIPTCKKWSEKRRGLYVVSRNDAPWCQFYEARNKQRNTCPCCGQSIRGI